MSTFKLALVLFRYFSFLLLLSAIIVHFAVAFVYVWFISIMNRRDAIECVSVCVCVWFLMVIFIIQHIMYALFTREEYDMF